MSGSKQVKERNHFVPQLLLRRFASRKDEKKAWVWQYRKGARPVEVSTKDAAVGRFFYGKPETGIEDGLGPLEIQTTSILNSLDRGDDPNLYAIELDRLTWLLFMRTRSLRLRFQQTANSLKDALVKELLDPRNRTLLSEKIAPKVKSQMEARLLFLPSEQRKFVRSQIDSILSSLPIDELATAAVGEVLASWNNDSTDGIIEGHINGLKELIPGQAAGKLFSNVKNWQVIDSRDQRFVLGDSCAFAVVDGKTRPLGKTDPEVSCSTLFLPISPSKVLVGLQCGALVDLTDERINSASIQQSAEMFFANENSEPTALAVGQIGQTASILTESEINEMVSDLLNRM